MKVGIVTNPFDPRSWEQHETADPSALLMGRFPSWPADARIFDLSGFGDWTRAASILDPSVLAARDVTPRDEAGVERLGALEGPLLVTVMPADPVTAIITVVAIVIAVASVLLFMPRINPDTQRPVSPNNALSSRTNQPRVNGRIADIYGTVEATLDLLAMPYAEFVNNQEVETAYMAIGRGSYDISRVRDGDTNVASIAGASVAIYAPFTSPNSGDPPQMQIGPAIEVPVRSVTKLNEVNGQTLKPSNETRVQGEDSIRFVYPDTIETNDPDVNFTEFFAAGDAIEVAQADIAGQVGSAGTTASARFTLAGLIEFDAIDPSALFMAGQSITVSNGGFAGEASGGGVVYVDLSGTYLIASVDADSITLDDPGGVNADWLTLDDLVGDATDYRNVNFSVPTATEGVNLNGSYTALAVTNSTIVLNNPALVNEAWDNLDGLDGGATEYVSPSISRNSESWIGPFIVDLDGTETVLANFLALNGLYTLSKKKGKQKPLAVTVELELTPVDASDVPTGPAQAFPTTLTGSQTERTTIGLSLFAEPPVAGRFSARARRTSATPDDDDYGSVVDEVKWKDCYGFAPVEQTEFGDLTTAMSRTVATPGALSLKERKLNMRVTRRVPARLGGSDFGDLAASNNVADIISAVCLDPFIGRRKVEEIDFDNIYDTIAEVAAYFGADQAAEFGYTFDDNDLSFEETVALIAQTCFCTAYRQGSVIRLTFERATEDSTLIFNARNILPGSQTRTVRFGPLNDHDGVELDYTDPADGAAMTFQLPHDGRPISPMKVEVPGVRSSELAYWQGWRAWNKARYQNTAVEFEATQEASLALPHDRVLVADRTRPGVLQGDIEAEDGTTLSLSHPAPLDPDQTYTIFIQHVDESVEALGCEPGADDYHVEISAEPRMDLSVETEHFARATYIIVPDGDVQTRAYLITERSAASAFTERVQAINYSFLYYQNDELVLWLDLADGTPADQGPYGRHALVVGDGAWALDETRGRVYVGAGAGGQLTVQIFDNPTSYTKAAWVRRDDALASGILESAHETFGFAADQLRAGHDGVAVSAPWDDGWHHAAVSYDQASAEMVLYIDGAAVDSAGGVPVRLDAQLLAADDLTGAIQDVRLWKRALVATEIMEVYRASRIRAMTGSILTEDGRALTTEDGRTLSWE